MANSLKNPKVASPYVVVLGGNRVPKTQSKAEELPERSVFTVVPQTKSPEVNPVTAPESVSQHKTPSFPSLKIAGEREEVSVEKNVMPRAVKNPFGMRFMRDLTKKVMLKSPQTILLKRSPRAVAMVAIAALVVGIPLSIKLFSHPKAIPSAQIVIAQGTNALLAQVGKSIILPANETPLVTIATVDDIKRLNLPDAKAGDKILIFQKAGQIVVYNGETDKVVGVVNRTAP